MQTEGEFDLEEIESRLYSQFYHFSSTEPEIPPLIQQLEPIRKETTYSISNVGQARYHNLKPNPAASNPPVDTARYESNLDLDNLTAAQLERRRLNKQRKNKRQKERRRIKRQQERLKDTEDDVIFVDMYYTDKVKPEKKEVIINHASDDVDDVIYIEPPPIPVINIEESASESNLEIVTETEERVPEMEQKQADVEKEQTEKIHAERTDLLNTPESNTSNDFLETHNSESAQNFNFSLHGSEFSEELPKHIHKASEVYETESSCSTSDFNHQIGFKTVVFNEVEFPKGDIFSDKNLESFGTFITPKRNDFVTTSCSTPKEKEQGEILNRSFCGSESSSESDYEDNISKANVKNLPELSPMQGKSITDPEGFKTPSTDLLKHISSPRNSNKRKKGTPKVGDQDDSIYMAKKKKNKALDKSEEETSCELEKSAGKLQKRLDKSPKGKKDKRKQSKSLDFNIQEGMNTSDSPETEPTNFSQNKVQNNESINPELNAKENTFEKNQESTPDTPITNNVSLVEKKRDGTIIEIDSQSEDDFADLPDVGDDVIVNISCNKEDKTVQDSFEHFDVCYLKSKMSDNPENWEIVTEDKWRVRRTEEQARCRRCKNVGHKAATCPKRVPVCVLCGQEGHRAPRCPNKICTNCGNKGDYPASYCYRCFDFRRILCHTCKFYGHHSRICPDLWRRYHLTTTEGPLTKAPKDSRRDQQDLWCSGCARQGHLEHNCKYLAREYLPSDPFIHSYEESYPKKTDQQQQPQFSTDNYDMVINPMHYEMRGANISDYSANTFVNYSKENSQEQNFSAPGQSETAANMRKRLEPKNFLKYTKFFMRGGVAQLKKFLREEIDLLDSFKFDPKFMNKKFLFLESILKNANLNSRKVQKEICYWHRQLNMFLFGVRGFNDGKRHLDFLNSFVMEPVYGPINYSVRKELKKSYNYIFGTDMHRNVDYFSFLKMAQFRRRV